MLTVQAAGEEGEKSVKKCSNYFSEMVNKSNSVVSMHKSLLGGELW
jgi:hypothetical protein